MIERLWEGKAITIVGTDELNVLEARIEELEKTGTALYRKIESSPDVCNLDEFDAWEAAPAGEEKPSPNDTKNAGVKTRGGPLQPISLCGGWEGPKDIVLSGHILPDEEVAHEKNTALAGKE